MSEHVCPWWVGYLLLLPLRRLRQSPRRWLGPLVEEGMVILEPGPGMGFFTLDLARMVGESGRVVAVDVQERMLDVLRRRAGKAGLLDRIDTRLSQPDGLGLDDIEGGVDLTVAIFVVHEMPDADLFYAEAHRAMRAGGRLFLAEPKYHVSRPEFDGSVAAAERAGFSRQAAVPLPGSLTALLVRS